MIFVLGKMGNVRVDKLRERVSGVVFPAGWYRDEERGSVPIIVADLKSGERVALVSLFSRETPEGVQIFNDEGEYLLFGHRSLDSDGDPRTYSSDFEGGYGRDKPLPLYELSGMQTTQTEFPDRIETLGNLSRYVSGDASREYDPVLSDVALFSAESDRFAMKIDEPDCVVSVLYDENAGQHSSFMANVVAEKTDSLDALGRPVYRITSLEKVDKPEGL